MAASTSKHHIFHQVGYDHLSASQRAFALSVLSIQEPSSYAEACKDPRWNQACKEEIYALYENQTWELVKLPPGKKPIGAKWVFKVKYRYDGTIERFKARLVAKGYTQIYGIDFLDTYSPVAKINSVKILLAVVVSKDWHIHQMDVSNAFLHGDLEEEVYLEIPPGIDVPRDSGLVFKLKKSLYHPKQASRQWFAKLTSALLKNGYSQIASDYSMFVRWIQGRVVVVLVYVDDILIAGSYLGDIEQLKKFLSKEFKVKDLGQLSYLLGLEVIRDHKGISVSQRKYCLELLDDTGFVEAKGCLSPVDCNVKLSVDQGELMADPGVYRRLIGRLHYLTITRPDVAYVQQLAQFQVAPCVEHLQAAHRVIRYLKQTLGKGLIFRADSKLELSSYCDADWASCPDSRRSLTGYCTFLGTSLIIWKTKK
ncbi:unnamed protein product [Linum trigynum]|uniref:Reverse transcriptase Ty1/copia-type domain-containing protein n=1 Tax=Linum trigynum TaxID=586398 RepID=A0AAV2FP99_9ROSI